MFPCNYQVNFTQTFENSQDVKCELGALPSAEVDVYENKSKVETGKAEKTEFTFPFAKSNTKQLV